MRALPIPWKLWFAVNKIDPVYGYFLGLFRNPDYFRKHLAWAELIKKIQIKKTNSYLLDRQQEIIAFWGVTIKDLYRLFKKSGPPGSAQFRSTLEASFESAINSNEVLMRVYSETSFEYTVRLMLAYDRYIMILPYWEYIRKYFSGGFSSLNVLDYGCGVSDIGLLFASMGANVTIVDLDNKKLKFTKWRFDVRGYNVTCVKLFDVDDVVDFDQGFFDIFIATELFEHVPDPLKLLKTLTLGLKIGGLMFDSMAGGFDRSVGGDHLPQAVKIGNSTAYKEFHCHHYRHLIDTPEKDCNSLFVKKT